MVLFGYSGGDTVADLLAALRDIAIKLITVAVNLNHTDWNDLHHIRPLIKLA